MKAITMRIQKSSRPLVILLATVVAIITSIVVANATQTITTPNAAFVQITNLASGGNSAAITPATNRPVLVMGCVTTSGVTPGVGQVTLNHQPGSGFLWVGLDAGGTTIGNNEGAGTHIVYIDLGRSVDIQVNSFDTIRVHNGAVAVANANVTLIW
jgi:hypothetical protein